MANLICTYRRGPDGEYMVDQEGVHNLIEQQLAPLRGEVERLLALMSQRCDNCNQWHPQLGEDQDWGWCNEYGPTWCSNVSGLRTHRSGGAACDRYLEKKP